MLLYAGSAIAQGPYVGRIDCGSEWKPTSEKPLWLLLSGATDPPKEIGISKRRTRDAQGDRNGVFLAGVTRDLVNMEDVVGTKLFNTVKDLYLTKTTALRHVTMVFKKCKQTKAKPMLYYTGHGEIGTGNWCFADGTISIQEIFDMVPVGGCYPMIFSDACYSGHWANFCLAKGISGFHCLAACPEYSMALDTKDEGGDLTLYMTGKKLRPRTEPVYSGGNRQDFDITRGYDTVDYIDFIGSHMFNSQNILISQNMHNGTFSGVFASSKLYNPRPVTTWGIRRNYGQFLAFANAEVSESSRIYSLACDEKFGFGVFFMKGYGTKQVIINSTVDIERKWDDGLEITSCAALHSTFYIIMTKDTKEYHGKPQKWFTCRTWKEANDDIQEGYKEGSVITGICYSIGLKLYFVVMTASMGEQCSRWFDRTEKKAMSDWEKKKYEQGFHPTIIFNDPTDNKTLSVMTKDKNRWGYVSRTNYKLRY